MTTRDKRDNIIIYIILLAFFILAFFFFKYGEKQDEEMKMYRQECDIYRDLNLQDIPGKCVSHFMPHGI